MPQIIARIVKQLPDRTEIHQKKVCKDPHDQRTCKNENYTAIYKDQIALTSYQCRRNPNVTELPWRSGTLFAGLFKNGTNNPFTRTPNCPGTYQKALLADNVIVCLSYNYDADKKFSIPFSNFFSCQWNAIYRKCPSTYSTFLATVANNCEIFYCMDPPG